eukprot:TRINITY_DN18176_c0_g1_i1.p1 TRINITY_DN18176_c0_g1~~TRINITY_DN18176_c0_g1_i1.p1  ORF type:complete len:234 (-),score=34.98 TRINITY_DN18176_c0_g1_i1:169-870(-)
MQTPRTASRNECDSLFKILLMGDNDSGKTALLLRFTDDVFSQEKRNYNYEPMLKLKKIEVDNEVVKMQIWDIDDSMKRIVTSSYFSAANAILLVFSVFSKEACDRLPLWIKELKSSMINSNALRFMIGHRYHPTTTDSEPERVLSTESAKDIATRAGFLYFEAEAKTGKNVNDMFSGLVQSYRTKSARSESNSKLRMNFSGNSEELNEEISIYPEEPHSSSTKSRQGCTCVCM